MIPNKDENKGDTTITSILFQCDCGGYHYFEVSYDRDKKSERLVDGLWFSFVQSPVSLWGWIVRWWENRDGWVKEVELNDNDVKELRDKLTEYLEFKKKEKENSKK